MFTWKNRAFQSYFWKYLSHVVWNRLDWLSIFVVGISVIYVLFLGVSTLLYGLQATFQGWFWFLLIHLVYWFIVPALCYLRVQRQFYIEERKARMDLVEKHLSDFTRKLQAGNVAINEARALIYAVKAALKVDPKLETVYRVIFSSRDWYSVLVAKHSIVFAIDGPNFDEKTNNGRWAKTVTISYTHPSKEQGVTEETSVFSIEL